MRTAELCTSQIGVILDDAGKPCAGGLLWFLDEAASTPRNIWSRDGDALRNPLPLGSDGCLTVQPYLEQGNYSLRLYKPTSPGAVYDPDDFPNGDWALVRTWLAAGAVPQTQLNGLSVEGVDGLKNLSVEDFAPGTAVIVDGYYQRGDCEARVFVLREGSATPDDATIVSALGGGAYWEWTPGGTLDARSFGAVPDGIRDVSGSLAALAAYAAAHSCAVVLPAGTYLVGGEGSVSFRHLSIQEGVSFVNGAAGSLYKIAVTGSIDCLLSAPLRNAGSAGKVLLDFTDAPSDLRARTSWNDGWGEVSGNGYSIVDWAGAATLAVSTNVALSQDVARIEVEAAAEVNGKPLGAAVNIGEVVSAGGQAVFAFGNFNIGKAYASAMRLGRTTTGSTIAVLVDTDWSISTAYPAPDYSGVVLYGVPNGGLVSVTTTSSDASVTIGGVVSESAVFGTLSLYTGGGMTCADSTKPLLAKHFSTLDADACRLVSVANGNVVDLEGRTATLSAPLSGATFKDGSVVIEDSTAWTNSVSFLRCALSIGAGVAFGTPNPLEARAFSFVDCTTDAPIVLVGGISGFVATGNTYTGAGSALDVSGVTSWTGHVRVAGNFPAEHIRTPADAYWPQTEGAILSGTTSGSSNNITATPSNYPVVLFIGSTDCALVATTQLGKAVKAYPVDGSSFKVETADGSNFASGDRVSCFYNYSR